MHRTHHIRINDPIDVERAPNRKGSETDHGVTVRAPPLGQMFWAIGECWWMLVITTNSYKAVIQTICYTYCDPDHGVGQEVETGCLPSY